MHCDKKGEGKLLFKFMKQNLWYKEIIGISLYHFKMHLLFIGYEEWICPLRHELKFWYDLKFWEMKLPAFHD
jgi:hypothetical protein